MRECFHHGGRIAAARAAFPDAQQPWIDLSTGLNPHPYPTAGLAIDWAPLPDEAQLAALETAAAAAFGVDAACLSAVPGTEIGLRLLATLGLPQPVRIASPAYGSYRDAWTDSLAIGAHDVEAAAAETGTIIIANPNNPDGLTRSVPELLALARRVAAAGGTLVVDEAFADAMPEASLLPHLGELDPAHLVVLRSFGKFYGLGGVRLGFVVCDAERLAQLRRRLGSWPLSSAAIAIGHAAYRDRAWADAARRRLTADAARLDGVLDRHGLAVTGDCPLFRLATVPDGVELFSRLAARGILTRPFDYAPGWLRFGLPGNESAWVRLDAALGDARG